MPRSPIRTEIMNHLRRHGPFEDPQQGKATSKLRMAIGFEGSEASFSQLISTMQRAGELTREVKGGKRTYRIAATSDSATVFHSDLDGPDTSDTVEMDYEQLASALLIQVVQSLLQGKRDRDEDGSWPGRRIERLERRINELERDLSHAKANAVRIANERDELRLQLEHSEGNLAILTHRMSAGNERESQASKALGPDERALLRQLRSRAAGQRPGRAS